MSSRIDLTLRPSRLVGLLASLPWLLLAAFLISGAAAGQPLLLVPLPAALAGAGISYRRLGLLSGRRAVTALSLQDNRLTVHTRRGSEPVVATGSSRPGARLTYLKLRVPGTRFRVYHVLLLAPGRSYSGNVCPEAFRCLRQWLRLGQPGTRLSLTREHS